MSCHVMYLFIEIALPFHYYENPDTRMSVLLLDLNIKGAAGHDVAFIHPRSAVGVLVELVQAPDDVISALSKKQDN